MVYRENALQVPNVAEDDLDRTLVSVDVSGRAGRPGVAGSDGHDGRGSGASGGPGSSAGPAEAGSPAGDIRVHLAPAEAAPETQLVMVGRTSHGEVSEQIPLDVGGLIDLRAVGGAGGRGGEGGDGGDGSKGRSGTNATRHRSGGRGGPGGAGGSGGSGTSGAAGGPGGSVEVSVAEPDTHLLMLIRSAVDGGDGGPAGRNGRGGDGGAGGSGGSSYSWTETEHYTDSHGKRRTRSRSRSNSGGSRGAPGPRGSDARATLSEGPTGADGHFSIVVHGDDGSERRYPDRYRPRLIGFAHTSANEDGIYEPLERIEVTGLMVENVGGMPTPSNHELCLVLESEGWVWPEEEHLVLPPSLAPGAITTLEGSLFFAVGDSLPEGPGDALEVTDHILHGAILPAAYRRFTGYHGTGDPKGRFVVRYPLRVSELECLHGLAPGEASRIRFSMQNLAARAFGERSEIARAVRFRLRPHDAELGAEHVTLYDAEDRALPYDEGWVQDVPLIGAGETLRFEGTVALDPSAPPYRSATFWLSLELAPPDGTAPRAIQHRAFEVRVAERYRPLEGCELLLVTSHRTTRAQLEAWHRLAERAALSMSIWDVSLEGHLDLERPVAGGTLRSQLAGGTVVVLDPPMQTPVGEVRPHRLLDRDQLRALVDASISVAVFGGQEGDVPLERWLVPDGDDEEPELEHESAAAFRSALGELQGGDGSLNETLDVHHVGVWFEAPTEKLLGERALALSTHLQHEYPHLRFVVQPTFAPELDSSWGVVRRWRVGTLTVRSTFDAASTQLVHASQVPDASDVDGERVEQVVLLSRDFDQKLVQVREAVLADRNPWPSLRAVLVDLVEEQRAILATGWRQGLSGSDMERAMPLLTKLVAHAASLGTPSLAHPSSGAFIELAARLSYFAGAQPRWWEWALYPARRAPRLRVATTDMLGAWLEAVFGEHVGEAARDAVDERRAALEREREASSEEDSNERDFARVMASGIVEWAGVTTDAEHLVDASSRVVDTEALGAIRAADRRDDAVRANVIAAQAGARERLLRRMRVTGAEESVEVRSEVESVVDEASKRGER